MHDSVADPRPPRGRSPDIEVPSGRAVGGRVRARIGNSSLHSPVHSTAEVGNPPRGLVLGSELEPDDATDCLVRLRRLRLRRHRGDNMLIQIWALRDHLNAYDAAHVALAEFLGAALITSDAKLGTAQVRRLVDVEVIR